MRRVGRVWVVLLLCGIGLSYGLAERVGDSLGGEQVPTQRTLREDEKSLLLNDVLSDVLRDVVDKDETTSLLQLPPGKVMPCMGLTAASCKPCAAAGPGPSAECETMKQMCSEEFCHSMCTKLTWRAKVAATGKGPTDGFKDEVNSAAVQRAMTAQMVAYGCADKFQCCDPEQMIDFVENNAFASFDGHVPRPAIPIQACRHDALDAEEADRVCNECKSAVQVTAEALECPTELGTPGGGVEIPGTSIFGDGDGKEASFVELELDYSALQKGLDDPDSAMYKYYSARKRRGVQAAGIMSPAKGDMQFQSTRAEARFEVGEAAHLSAYDRCAKLQAKVAGKMSAIASELNEKACDCLGCCAGEHCFYPTVYNSPDELPE